MIAWRAPQTIRSDMGAAGLSGLFATIATSGSARDADPAADRARRRCRTAVRG